MSSEGVSEKKTDEVPVYALYINKLDVKIGSSICIIAAILILGALLGSISLILAAFGCGVGVPGPGGTWVYYLDGTNDAERVEMCRSAKLTAGGATAVFFIALGIFIAVWKAPRPEIEWIEIKPAPWWIPTGLCTIVQGMKRE